MSIIASPYTIPAVLRQAETEIGAQRVWEPINDEQRQLLASLQEAVEQVALIPEIESIASRDVRIVNQFLSERGFTISLPELAPLTIGVAAVLKALCEWMIPGKRKPLQARDGKTYPGVYLEQEMPAYKVDWHRYPVVCLFTQKEDLVYLTLVDEPPANEFEMLALVSKLMMEKYARDYGEVHFPMVNLDITMPLDWLKGLHTTSTKGEPVTISQAVRQTRLKMNEYGVLFEEAVAAGMTLGVHIPRVFVIDAPFLIWCERRDLSLPLYAGYITQKDWSDPGPIK